MADINQSYRLFVWKELFIANVKKPDDGMFNGTLSAYIYIYPKWRLFSYKDDPTDAE